MLSRGISTRLESLGIVELPNFLCPALLRPISGTLLQYPRKTFQSRSGNLRRQFLHNEVHKRPCHDQQAAVSRLVRLPQQCGGCGSLSQVTSDGEPGFFSLSRRSVKEYLGCEVPKKFARKILEGQVWESSLQIVENEVLKTLQHDSPGSKSITAIVPLCDRCHRLTHHQKGDSIQHPSIESIHKTIMESPHKYNHVYHIVDAADFPMSFIPHLNALLNLSPQRSLNRRSRAGRFYHGKKTEVSFIITRSDLFAPLKTQVDSLMPCLVGILRDVLGSMGKDVRLGNVRCVSAKRGWWTKELKEDIWNRGGAGWMVGKVNVGKSQLFESVFPKGRCNTVKGHRLLANGTQLDLDEADLTGKDNMAKVYNDSLDDLSLLPPAQPETDFPEMPLVSSLPGTTASPIRVPFRNGRGELVDLPGLHRGDLELHVQESHRDSLVMKSRIQPEQQVMKPGQSIVIGGFIRITPVTPDTVFLAYSFTPMQSHLTSTEKAISIQKQDPGMGTLNIAVAGTGEKILSAGRFPLKWDVTKQRSGPITERSAAGIKVERLPWRVLSTDILIEGCGWVELVAQVRVKSFEKPFPPPVISAFGPSQESEISCSEPEWPQVEVFSPEGRFISSRKPLGAWLLNRPRQVTIKSRPRKSMKSAKRQRKAIVD